MQNLNVKICKTGQKTGATPENAVVTTADGSKQIFVARFDVKKKKSKAKKKWANHGRLRR